MALEILLLVSLFCSLSMSYDNGPLLWEGCPSNQSVRGPKGSLFEITIQIIENECKKLLHESEIKEATEIRKQKNGLDMQLTINKERANITWNVWYKNRCYRQIYMLDVEYLIKNSRGDGVLASHLCFQFNVSKIENKQKKERVELYFDCIRTVPDREAYLVNIKLWSLQQNWSISTRSRRSVKSNCGRIQCTTPVKKYLSIGPIKPIRGEVDDKERIKRCQCWSNSTISLQTPNTEERPFLIVVGNPNPYATVIITKVYKEGSNILPVFTVSSVEKRDKFWTDISCDKEDGTYTPVLGYNCGDQEYSFNSLCQLQDIEGPAITCHGPVEKNVSPSEDIPHLAIAMVVLVGCLVTVTVTAIIFVYKHTAFLKCLIRKKGQDSDNHFNPDVTPVGTGSGTPIVDSDDVSLRLLSLPDVPSTSWQIMFLDHTDSSITPLRKDCVDLITKLLQAAGIELIGLNIMNLFKNWIEVADRASRDDITDCLIILSTELVSCHKSYMDPTNSTKSLNSADCFSGAVLKALRDRYFQPGRVPFRIHILCLEYSDIQLCKQYTDTYRSFMIVENPEENTFLYSFAKSLEDANSSVIFDGNVMPRLLERLNGTTLLPEDASVLSETFSKLFHD